jgi:hypothetical protein
MDVARDRRETAGKQAEQESPMKERTPYNATLLRALATPSPCDYDGHWEHSDDSRCPHYTKCKHGRSCATFGVFITLARFRKAGPRHPSERLYRKQFLEKDASPA